MKSSAKTFRAIIPIIGLSFLLASCGSYRQGMVECGKNGYAGYGTPFKTAHGAHRTSY